MKHLIVIAIFGFLMWQGYEKYQSSRIPEDASHSIAADRENSMPQADVASTSVFKCDGRTYCSHMTSCAEATYFLRNCAGVKMDGNNDGIPCEQQWCK